jgi:hypothetical protein
MAVFWTGQQHSTPGVANQARDYDAIERAGRVARDAVWRQDLALLAESVRLSSDVQTAEGMAPLPADLPGMLAAKYCGGGFGGYAAYIFAEGAMRDAACSRPGFRPIEPYVAHHS